MSKRKRKRTLATVAAESDLCGVCGWHLDLVAMHENCRPSSTVPGLEPYTDTHDGDTEPGAPWPEISPE